MKEPKDKRTKAYREWKANYDKENSIGLGDVIETFTEATGIKKAVKAIFGGDCGCEERKERANKKFRFSYNRRNVRCFTEEMYNKWADFKDKKNKTSPEDIEFIAQVGEQLFAINYRNQMSKCGDCRKYLIIDINRVYDQYQ